MKMEASKPYALFLDDVREIKDVFGETENPIDWEIARSSEEAKKIVLERGLPFHISFDHDLGGEDTAMNFVKWMANEYWDNSWHCVTWNVHSANPVGAANIRAFMHSWSKVCREKK
jgi:hypothetical protein